MELSFNDPSLKGLGLTVKLLRSGKLILKLEGESAHFTLHPGHRSGIMDLHKTDELALEGDVLKHHTIGKLSKAELVRRMSVIGPHLVAELITLVRPIRLGWIMRRHLGIGGAFPSESTLQGISGIRVRRGEARLSEPRESWMQPPEFYDEVLQYPGRAFCLYDCKKRSSIPYGLVFTYRTPYGHVRMKWIRWRDALKWAAKWEPLFFELFRPLWDTTVERGHRANAASHSAIRTLRIQ